MVLIDRELYAVYLQYINNLEGYLNIYENLVKKWIKRMDIMSKLTADEVLHYFTELAPYLNDISAEDLGISVIKDGFYTAYVPGKELDLGLKAGEPMKGQVSEQCMRTGERITVVVPKNKSVFGIPYLACAMPIKDGNRTVGCIITTQTIEVHEKISTVASDLSASSQELSAGMEELAARSSKLEETSNQLDSIGKELARSIKQTDEIVSFIHNIASETNLLGLNAAIEAARVGELGQGFGVVANEVRKLADASSQSAKHINSSLNEIQRSIKELSDRINIIFSAVQEQSSAVEVMTENSQSVAQMAIELSNVANKMFKS